MQTNKVLSCSCGCVSKYSWWSPPLPHPGPQIRHTSTLYHSLPACQVSYSLLLWVRKTTWRKSLHGNPLLQDLYSLLVVLGVIVSCVREQLTLLRKGALLHFVLKITYHVSKGTFTHSRRLSSTGEATVLRAGTHWLVFTALAIAI